MNVITCSFPSFLFCSEVFFFPGKHWNLSNACSQVFFQIVFQKFAYLWVQHLLLCWAWDSEPFLTPHLPCSVAQTLIPEGRVFQALMWADSQLGWTNNRSLAWDWRSGGRQKPGHLSSLSLPLNHLRGSSAQWKDLAHIFSQVRPGPMASGSTLVCLFSSRSGSGSCWCESLDCLTVQPGAVRK